MFCCCFGSDNSSKYCACCELLCIFQPVYLQCFLFVSSLFLGFLFSVICFVLFRMVFVWLVEFLVCVNLLLVVLLIDLARLIQASLLISGLSSALV